MALTKEEHKMNSLARRQRIVLGVVLLATIMSAIFSAPAHAQAVAPTNQWAFSITPYVWLPNINGTLKYSVPPGASGSPEVEAGPNDYLENLQAVITRCRLRGTDKPGLDA
jgi:hypothetical protein